MFFADAPFGKKKHPSSDPPTGSSESTPSTNDDAATTPSPVAATSSSGEPGAKLTAGGFSVPEVKKNPVLKAGTPTIGGLASPAGGTLTIDQVDPALIAEKTSMRVPYFEAKEAMDLEQKEIKAVKEIIGAEIRERCRPEIDEYVDCMVGRLWTVLQCKPMAKEMRRCLKRIETPEYVDRRIAEVLEERQINGTSLLKSKDRSLHNKCFWEERDSQTSRHTF
eukprot:GEMP01081355.1.p1 GENE.GEMP01081355.1~~GEMP01081355.1.p1  ORF type:complete len:222 (+),score=51.62 GEMP01081355.1:39-704(+)